MTFARMVLLGELHSSTIATVSAATAAEKVALSLILESAGHRWMMKAISEFFFSRFSFNSLFLLPNFKALYKKQ